MNREILFRGKRKDNNEWVYGYLVFSEDYIFDYSERIDIPYVIPIGNFNLKDYRDYRVDENTIGQYTGLTDKNGKKIFEGDIIDIHQTVNGYNQFVIEYDNYKFSARYYNQKTKEIRSWYGYDLDELFEINEFEKELEVIGNIYESKINE